MKKIILTSLLFALCAEFDGTLHADIAPPVFPGYSLSPFDTKGVRMKSEKIDIYYGEPCRIDAIYEIVNPTKEIVEQKIGFPFTFNMTATRSWGWGHHDTASKIYDFTMSLNGENLVETDVPLGSEIRSDNKYWYGWTCKLKPNLNIVKLAYHVVTTAGPYRWERNLCYEFTSEKNWPEKIEHAQVTVHFPEYINKGQILDGTSPDGYELKGKEINWQFRPYPKKYHV